MKEETSKSNFLKNAILSDALMSYDMNYQTKTYREIGMDIRASYYTEEINNRKYDYLRDLTTMICHHNGEKQYDVNLPDFSEAKQKEIFINSINNSIERFSNIASNENYKKQFFSPEKKKGTLLSDKHNEIIHYLKDKISTSKKLKKILDLLKFTKNNFILKSG